MEPARSAIAWPRERMVWMASSARPPNASATMGMHSTPASRQAGRLEASLRCTPTWRAWPGVTEASGRVCCWRERQIYALNNYSFLEVNGMPILHLW